MTFSLKEAQKSSFEDRMRSVLIGDRKREAAKKEAKKKLPENIKIVTTLDEYKNVVGNEKDRIVVVRFFARWCKVRSWL